jgi:Peptidase inhibitor family I36
MSKQAQTISTRSSMFAILLFGVSACGLEDDELGEPVEDRAVDLVDLEDQLDIDDVDDDRALDVTELEAEQLGGLGPCATMYEHSNFGGDRRDVSDGAFVSWIGGPWNDHVSSVWVRGGCAFNAYEHINFGGAQKSFQGVVPWVGNGWNDKISSYTCYC